jgi:hypothetical protein
VETSFPFVTEPNSEWTAGYTRAVRKTPIENSLALELGEFFYQLRAALDTLIYQTAVYIEKDPPSNVESLYFPVCIKQKTFRDTPIYTLPFPADLVSWLESLQPYMAGQTTNPDTLEVIRLLSLIHKCAKIDRHRHLHIVAAFPTRLECQFAKDPPTLNVTAIKGVRVNFLESDAPFLFFGIEGADLSRSNHIKLKTDLRLEVAIDQIPIAPGERLDTEINKMLAAVDYVVRWFESGFSL